MNNSVFTAGFLACCFISFSFYLNARSAAQVEVPRLEIRNEPRQKVNRVISGVVNETFAKAFETSLKDKDLILVSSRGGSIEFGLDAAESIEKHQVKLLVDGNFGPCFSACAEYLLPAAKHVYFENDPLIGFHWNAQINMHLFELANDIKHKAEFCDVLNSQVNRTEALLNRNKLRTDFWKQTLKRIEIDFFQPSVLRHSCKAAERKFKHELWLPNSVHLKRYLGLKYNGAVCADNVHACREKVDKVMLKGVSVVIGDEIYVSKGPE